MSESFKMVCYGQCSCNRDYNWGLVGVPKSENKFVENCPDCKSVLVKKFDKAQYRKLKEPKIKRIADAEHGLKTKPKDYLT